MAPTTDSLNSAKLAAEILKAVSGRDCIAWIGSGLSRPVYDDWPSAISKLCKACGVKDLDGSLPGRKSDQLIDKAEECKQANEGLYEATLADIYGRDEVKSRRAYMWLLKAPFKAYVTTNFDPLLSETAAAFEHTDLFCYPLLEGRDLERKSKPIFYIHGHARPNGTPSGKNLVLARSEFTKAYQGIVGVFVQNLLLSYPIVFIGCRLSDPDIYEQMSRVHSMHTQIKTTRTDFVPRTRLALLPTIFRESSAAVLGAKPERDVTEEEQEATLFRAFDTEVLRYDAADPQQHWEVDDMLQHLCKLCSETPTVSLGEAGPK